MAETTYSSNTLLSVWLKTASKAHKDALRLLTGFSIEMLRQWATGRRNISAGNAGRVEDAMSTMARDPGGPDTVLTRGDLCASCKQCPYYKAAQSSVPATDN